MTLKRARRVRPLRTKKERMSVSREVRRPRAKAREAGATPKEIWESVRQSFARSRFEAGQGRMMYRKQNRWQRGSL